jgi:diguanylate cyclase (GGDEF)-like protein
MRILLVDDDEVISGSLSKALTEQHYVVDVAADGLAGWDFAESFTYDLILLDIMLPKLDGIALCRRLRSHNNTTPVLLLTAQDASTSKVSGLDAGADDYLAKPFDTKELLARIRALLRRGSTALLHDLEWDRLYVDPNACNVTWEGQPVKLTPKEYRLLELFLRNPQRIYSNSTLIDHLWSFDDVPTEDTIRSHIRGLRAKLKTAGMSQDPIETMYGIGYRLRAIEVSPSETDLLIEDVEPKSLKDKKGKKGSKKKQRKDDHLFEEKKQTKTETTESRTASGIAEIWNQVKDELDRRIRAIETAQTALLDDSLSNKQHEQAEQTAHKLVGSLGMFGCDEGSRLSREIEQLLREKRLNAEQKTRLTTYTIALREEFHQMNSDVVAQTLVAESSNLPLILVVDNDRAWCASLEAEATKWSFQVQTVPDLATARRKLTHQTPVVVLLNVSDDQGEELVLIADLQSCTPPIPVLVFTQDDRLLDRVNIARLGGRGILRKPMFAVQVLETVNQLVQQTQSEQAKVMVVDDDPLILSALRNLLVPWGIVVTTLDQPLRFLDTLKTALPDLLVLDVDMPEVSGLELCQVVRQDPDWNGLPILFLTARSDRETRQQVFASGADDYVNKPIVEAELVTRILNRLERSRLMRYWAETDSLTGIANRRCSTQNLTKFISLAERQQKPFSFAILDVDNFKRVNDQYGHEMGDRVLSALGYLLKTSFRSEDTVGRWGGEEFVIGLYGATQFEAIDRLSALLATFRSQTLLAPNGDAVQVTFSAGVACYPENKPDLQTLYQSADSALRQAKETGRNQVLSN